RANRSEILDRNVARQRRRIYKQVGVADLAVMSYVRIGKHQILIAETRGPAALFRAAAHGHVLAENVFVADAQFGAFTSERVGLGITAQHAKRMKNIGGAKARGSVNHGMWIDNAIFAEFDLFADNRECSDAHAARKFRRSRN